MESCPSWSKEHDWKSCNRLKRFEGSNPLLSAINIGYSVCCTLYFFDKTARNSNPYNLLQDEVLSKEVYNRIVCGANSRANEVSRVPHSPPRIKGIAFAIPFIFLLIRQQGIRTLTIFCKTKSCQKKSIIG